MSWTWKRIGESRMHDLGEMRMVPMPSGPYIKVCQFDWRRYDGQTWENAMEIARSHCEVREFFPDGSSGQIEHGTIVYANIDGVAIMVAHRYDSSD